MPSRAKRGAKKRILELVLEGVDTPTALWKKIHGERVVGSKRDFQAALYELRDEGVLVFKGGHRKKIELSQLHELLQKFSDALKQRADVKSIIENCKSELRRLKNDYSRCVFIVELIVRELGNYLMAVDRSSRLKLWYDYLPTLVDFLDEALKDFTSRFTRILAELGAEHPKLVEQAVNLTFGTLSERVERLDGLLYRKKEKVVKPPPWFKVKP